MNTPSYLDAFISLCAFHVFHKGSCFHVVTQGTRQAAGKKSKNCMFFTKEDMEIQEGKILCPRPLAMSTLSAQAGSPQDFSVPHTHPGHGREGALREGGEGPGGLCTWGRR